MQSATKELQGQTPRQANCPHRAPLHKKQLKSLCFSIQIADYKGMRQADAHSSQKCASARHLKDKFHVPVSPLSHQSSQALPQPWTLSRLPSHKPQVPGRMWFWKQLWAKWISEQNKASRLHLHGAPATQHSLSKSLRAEVFLIKYLVNSD